LLITTKFVPESLNPDAGRVDWLGTIVITLGLIGTSFGFIQGPVLGWSSIEILLSLIGGISAIICFFIIESRVKAPIMPLKIFKNPLVLGANLVTFFLYFALNGVIFFLVLNFQQVQNYSPILSGLGLLPPILIITFFSGKAGSIADKIGARPQMILGPIIVSIGLALFIIPGVGDNYFTHFFPGLILFGSGMALVIAPLTKSALSVHKAYSGSASGVNNAVSRIAAMIAIAALGALMISVFTVNLNGSVNASPLSDDEKSQILIQTNKLGGIDIPEDFSETSRIIAEESVNISFVHGFRWAMGLSSLFAFIGAIISFITIHNPKHENKVGMDYLN
jgi:hypothetical protein